MKNTAIVTFAVTYTSERLPTNRLAVGVPTYYRLCREAGVDGVDEQLHITTNTIDAEKLDSLDDALRDRSQTVGDFAGRECVVLLPGQGIDRCDVWLLATVAAEDEVTPAALVSLDNGNSLTAVGDLTDDQIALCVADAQTFGAEFCDRVVADDPREWVAKFAALVGESFGEVWTLP